VASPQPSLMTWNGCPTLGVLGDPRVRLTSAVRRLFVKHYLRALRCLSALLLPPTACQCAGGGCSWMPFAFLPVSDPGSCSYVAHLRRGKALVWLSTVAIWGALEHFGNVSGCGARASGGGQRFCWRSGATCRGEGSVTFGASGATRPLPVSLGSAAMLTRGAVGTGHTVDKDGVKTAARTHPK
jgi:hypothetical protein